MKVDELLEDLTDLLEDSKELPVVNKVMVDKVKISEIIDEIKANLPAETRQAKRIVSERNKILDEAKKQAETLISAATQQRTDMLESSEIVKQARQEAQRIIFEAQTTSKKIKNATNNYVDTVLQKTEEALSVNLTDFHKKRQAILSLKNSAQSSAAAPSISSAPSVNVNKGNNNQAT
ncbi:MAG: ATPase [Clostridia bacterium]|nr:ATPase [Clostridia bacterium]